MNSFQISASVTDFPLFLKLDTVFAGLKNAGVDGVELVIGIKSRWAEKRLKELSLKYELPIITMHQPIWSAISHFFDMKFVDMAVFLGVKEIVFHPLPFYSPDSKLMKDYFNTLLQIQQSYGIKILLENMPKKYGLKVGKYSIPVQDNGYYSLDRLRETAEKYNFGITYDVSHRMFSKPQDEESFQKLLERLGNVHLSSFDHREHLPLYMGKFDSVGFLNYLKEKDYKGHLTFEIFYPHSFYFTKYDFNSIKRSVEIVKSV